MSLSLDFFTFLNCWFLTLFMVVPFFVRPNEKRDVLEYAAAPRALPWKKVLLVNTLVSFLMAVAITLVVQSNLFIMRDALS